MKYLIFDGHEFVSLSAHAILRELPLERVLEYYQCSWVFRQTAKEFVAEQSSLLSEVVQYQIRQLETGLDRLYQRLVLELGEESADLFVARTSVDLILSSR